MLNFLLDLEGPTTAVYNPQQLHGRIFDPSWNTYELMGRGLVKKESILKLEDGYNE